MLSFTKTVYVIRTAKRIDTNCQPTIVMPWEFYDENIQMVWFLFFCVDIPKMYVYVSETFADRNYDVIKMAAKKPQRLLFWSSSKKAYYFIFI